MNKKQSDAIEHLKSILNPSDTIGIAIKSVSKSGMSRRMRVYTNTFQDISCYVADAIEHSLNGKGIYIRGCGMDMAFWLAKTLSYYLWGKGSKDYKGNGGKCINWIVI